MTQQQLKHFPKLNFIQSIYGSVVVFDRYTINWCYVREEEENSKIQHSDLQGREK